MSQTHDNTRMGSQMRVLTPLEQDDFMALMISFYTNCPLDYLDPKKITAGVHAAIEEFNRLNP